MEWIPLLEKDFKYLNYIRYLCLEQNPATNLPIWKPQLHMKTKKNPDKQPKNPKQNKQTQTNQTKNQAKLYKLRRCRVSVWKEVLKQ